MQDSKMCFLSIYGNLVGLRLSLIPRLASQKAAYRKAGMGYKQIAKELDLSANSVKSYCRRNGLGSEALEQSLPESACVNCGKSIEQKKKKRFCPDKCRNQWWNSHLNQVKRKAIYEYICPVCGKSFSVYGNAKRSCYLCVLE